MNKSRLDEWQLFLEFEEYREKVKLSPKLQSFFSYCEYIIHTQFDKNTKNKYHFKKKKNDLTEQHCQAIKELSQDQKLSYYLTFMKIVKAINDGRGFEEFCEKPKTKENIISDEVYSRSYNLKIWKHKKLRLDREKHILHAERENKIKTYDLSNYILRISKNTDYHSFVLEAINNKPHAKSRTVHLGFKESSKLDFWINELNIIYKQIYWNFIYSEFKGEGKKLYQSYAFGTREETQAKLESIDKRENLAKSMIVSEDYPQKMENFQIIKEEVSKQQSKAPHQSLETARNENEFIEQEEEFSRGRRQTIIESLANIHVDDQEEMEKIQQKQEMYMNSTSKSVQNIFSRIMPEYHLGDLENTMYYGILLQDGPLRVFGHVEKPTKVKLFLDFTKNLSQQEILTFISIPSLMKKCNKGIQEIEIKTLIKSQNSALIYQKNSPYNKLYRSRDFVYLRHIFKKNDTYYMIDKSMENINYPPFITIVRGQLSILWGIKKLENSILLVADVQMNNEGYLNSTQDLNLTMKFLKQFKDMENMILENRNMLENYKLFDDDWDITEEIEDEEKPTNRRTTNKAIKGNESAFKKKTNETITVETVERERKTKIQIKVEEKKQPIEVQEKKENFITVQEEEESQISIKTQKKIKETISENPNNFYLQKNIQDQKGEIEENQDKKLTVHEIERNLDEKGHVIISQNFIHTRYITQPVAQKALIYQEAIKGHPIWKGQWIHDKEVGGIIFINEKKIQDQKGVLKFIIAKMGKNIIERKSILQISLPVDIFSSESNLQRLVYSMTYAPKFLDPAANEKNILNKMKLVIGFGLSNSPLYLNMEKPFNPILGETFQCWINGCPVYAEQISHHPPIAALWFQGRGYRITAQLQSKVEFHMNSGCGTNDGIYRVSFKDNSEVCFITPGGEVSGLTYGDRKFNMVGKSYYWVKQENLFIEIVFDPTKKGFFSVGKQEKPSDYFEGEICVVKPDFMKAFLNGKRRGPYEKQIQKKLGKIHGIWNKILKFNDEILLNIDEDFPVKLEYEANPLPSDANWRQDIHYRRMDQISRAQSEKQRLEVLQRKDRKLREAKKKKK